MSRPIPGSVRVAGAVLTTLVCVSLAGAQEPSFGPLVAGSRVRLRAPTVFEGRVEGQVLDVDEESILIGTEQGRRFRVPRDTVAGLEVSTGRRGQALKGLAVGAAIGAGVFAVIPRDEYCADYVGSSCPDRAEMVATGAVGGGLWGLLLGHFCKTDRWSPVPAAGAQWSVAPARVRDGWGVRMAIGW